MLHLNQRARTVAQRLIDGAEQFRVSLSTHDGAVVIDCGAQSAGGLQAGCLLAQVCLAGLADVHVTTGNAAVWNGPWISVATDHPVAACMASQYAGWPLSYDNFFAMGSGPMRAARGREPLLERLGLTETAQHAVGVLETAQLPSPEVLLDVAGQCRVAPENLTLLVARTASLAGTVQVVARSVETALHKLLEIDFDLHRVVAGFGVAPLPPVAANDLAGIGRTNDAVLYGGQVTLWVRGDDASLQAAGQQVPSCTSADHGRPFAEIFESYERDFYRIDPLLFSPAEIHLVNIESGRMFQYGRPEPAILQASFGGPS